MKKKGQRFRGIPTFAVDYGNVHQGIGAKEKTTDDESSSSYPVAQKVRLKYFRQTRRQAMIMNAVSGIPNIIPRIPPRADPQKKIDTITTTG